MYSDNSLQTEQHDKLKKKNVRNCCSCKDLLIFVHVQNNEKL